MSPLGDLRLAIEEPVFRTLAIAVGVGLLSVGRRLFWLAVAALGFTLAFALVQELSGDADPGVALALGLAGGVLGAVLAVAVQRIAIVVAGFLLGALATAGVLPSLGSFSDAQTLLLSLGGGLLGAALSLGVASLALRLVTAAVGALLIVEASGLPSPWGRLLFVTLWALGFVVQGRGGGERS